MFFPSMNVDLNAKIKYLVSLARVGYGYSADARLDVFKDPEPNVWRQSVIMIGLTKCADFRL